LSFVSSELLEQYFNNFSVEELDIELFEALKKRLFKNILFKEKENYTSRWRNQNQLINQTETKSIPKENSQMINRTKPPENCYSISQSHNPKLIDIIDHKRIISAFIQENPNSFNLTSSYNDCNNGKIETILRYNDSYWCGCLTTIQEHWFCFEFKKNKFHL
jgi:hypothetical protein